jgi:hypothetical protein
LQKKRRTKFEAQRILCSNKNFENSNLVFFLKRVGIEKMKKLKMHRVVHASKIYIYSRGLKPKDHLDILYNRDKELEYEEQKGQ